MLVAVLMLVLVIHLIVVIDVHGDVILLEILGLGSSISNAWIGKKLVLLLLD